MRVPGLALVMVIAAAAPAWASAGFWCEADDASAVFSVDGGLARSLPGRPFNVGGSLKVKLAGAPADLSNLKLADDDLAQSWVDGEEIRLQVYRERREGLFASIDLVILTKALPMDEDTEGAYAGTYTLTVSEIATEDAVEATTKTVTGAVSCSIG